ncbi:MAG: hypothetical protein RR652_03435, partial [Mucinivorans sp.]
FKASMDQLIETFRAAVPIEGHDRVMVPGDVEREKSERIMREGIVLLPSIEADMRQVSTELGLEF